MATKKQSPEPKAKAKATSVVPVAGKSSPKSAAVTNVSSAGGEKRSKKPSPASKAAPSAPAKAIMEKTAPKTSQTKDAPKAPKVETTPPKTKPTKTAPAVVEPVVGEAASVKPTKAPKQLSNVLAEPAETTAKVAKAVKPVKDVKAAKDAKPETAVVVEVVPTAIAPAPVKEPKESKKAVKPPTAKSIAADAISALAVATPSAAALAENAVKAAKPAPAPTPRVAPTPAKGSLVPITPRLVKLLKAPALNLEDPFDGIDDLSEGQFLTQQQEVLIIERRQYESSATMLQAEADQLAADMEPGDVQFDDESGEGTGVSVERERDIAMAQKASETVDEIDRALNRIGIGTYGYCIECHEMINRDRLRAMPFAVLCMKCKTGGLSRR